MTCFYCKSNMKESTTTHVVDLKECLIIVRGVPCFECEQCGETAYTDEVARKLDQIVKACRAIASEITVINYADKVA